MWKSEEQKAADYVGSWSTPVVAKAGGRTELVVSWPAQVKGYEPETGKVLWNAKGLEKEGGNDRLTYTSALVSDKYVFAAAGYGGAAIGVKTGGTGDVTESHRLFRAAKNPQRIGSGVIHEGHIYIHNDPGTAMCLNLETGKEVWNERLTGGSASGQNWSSVLLADGKCYTITQGGDCFVFKASPSFELLATNPLGERSNSSVAASQGALFIRTHKSLWCVQTP